ncbi:Dam family site-specific DNA-(adenine-N6)-methyltransferase [Gemella sp.]
MRYIGNKSSILNDIYELFEEKNLLNKDLILFDAFCGTGSVSDYFKKNFKIIINDNLNWATTYAKGKLIANNCTFEKLGVNPFSYLNNNTEIRKGFIYKNYTPANSNRMYFSEYNGGRIDYFRWQIEYWKVNQKISQDEYLYLLSSLVESVSKVSNTAGVYGAFLKKWDTRALKEIKFEAVESSNGNPISVKVFCDKIENIVQDIHCDILYLDPPYTQNQYGTQYHLLETLVLYDAPEVSKVTGSRPTAPMRSDWSKDIKSHILFDKLIAKTKAKYIIFSYNTDGFMSKEYIESVLKRYGKKETYTFKKIPYKKYKNWKSKKSDQHYEYLFFIEKKKDNDIVYESPLNYIGSKFKIIPKMKEYLPKNYNTFWDIFGGGGNVGGNINNHKVVYNDLNYMVTELISSFKFNDTYKYIKLIKKQIKDFKLEKGNKEAFLNARQYYNNLPINKRKPEFLYILIMYGFQQQIRFNSSYEFNNPPGIRWFNDKILEKLISFSRHIKEIDYHFICKDYIELKEQIKKNDLVYLDPPYKLTTGSYNDGKRGFKGWNDELEAEMFDFLNQINSSGIKFMLSYVEEHKGERNHSLLNWIENNNYTKLNLGDVSGISGKKRKEILVINYEL